MESTRELLIAFSIAASLAACEATNVDRSGPDRPPEEWGDDDAVEEDGDDDDDERPEPDAAVVRPARPDGGVIDGGPRPPLLPPAPTPQRLTALITADRPPPPISGGTLTVTSDGAYAVAADPDRDSLYVVKTADQTVRTVALPEGSEPGRVVLDGSGQVHVALRSSGALARVALGSSEGAKATNVCQHPRGLAYDVSRDAINVACANGELVVLSAKTHAELSRTFVALDLRDVIITPSGERFVSRYRSAQLLRLTAEGKVSSASSPKDGRGFSNNGMAVTLQPTLAWRTIATADGRPIMLHQKSQEEAVVVQPGGYGGGCQTITQPGATEYDETGKPVLTGTFMGAGLTVDVAVSADGKLLAMAAPAGYLSGTTGSVRVLPRSALTGEQEPASVSILKDVPALPTPSRDGGTALPPDAGPFPAGPLRLPNRGGCDGAWTTGADMQATAVAFDDAGALYALSREPAQLVIYDSNSTESVTDASFTVRTTIALSDRTMRDTGHELFHANVGGGLSCASCHGEALDDGHVWTFEGFGPRRTQNMRGGILSTLPLHWEGDMPTFQHLVDEVMTKRMSGFVVEPRYADALAKWIDAQPELALEHAASGDAQVERGRVLFDSVELACATCHSGPQLTNNESADVGTGGLFQVPSLRGLGLRAPFMHDGCAKTLRDRFDPLCGGGDRHGKTSQLSEAQIADVVAYLSSL